MPFITIKLAKGRTVEQKQQFVEAITKEAVKILNVKEEWVTVIFDEYDWENWATSGELHSIKLGKGYGKPALNKRYDEKIIILDIPF